MKNWKQQLVEHFKEGEKCKCVARLGVEVEHFVLDPARGFEAVPYAGEGGIREVLCRLMERYPEARVLEDDEFFGFTVPEFSVTLEPAAQLEISIASEESVAKVGRIYRGFRKNLDEVLAGFGYAAVTVGCQPISRVEDLTLIPKRRYDLMNRHFMEVGTGGKEMMRGSASIQVSIDYSSEEDFRRKFQAAHYYMPILKILMENARIFQRELLTGHLKRTDIWRRVDPARCGMLPHVFSASYGYGDYADFLGDMPPIFLKRGKEILPTGTQTTAQIFEQQEMTEEDVDHVISMAFPVVRLKQYIEIRFADSSPLPFVLAYTALLKGLLYSEEGLDYAHEKITGGLTEEDVHQAEDELTVRGWKADIYGEPVRKQAERLLEMAQSHLPDDEKAYIAPLEAVIEYGGISGIPEERRTVILDKMEEMIQ